MTLELPALRLIINPLSNTDLLSHYNTLSQSKIDEMQCWRVSKLVPLPRRSSISKLLKCHKTKSEWLNFTKAQVLTAGAWRWYLGSQLLWIQRESDTEPGHRPSGLLSSPHGISFQSNQGVFLPPTPQSLEPWPARENTGSDLIKITSVRTGEKCNI